MINLTKEEIEIIKEELGVIDTFEENELDEIKNQRKKSGVEKITLAKLFMTCYDTFKNNLDKFGDKKQKIKDQLSIFKVDELRDDLEDYGDGGFGTKYVGERIKDYVKEHREKMSEFVDLFFSVFIIGGSF